MKLELFKDNFDAREAKALNSLTLAFIGDAIYEVFVRHYLIDSNRDMCVNKLHKETVEFVKAQAQCEFMNNIMDYLTEEEISIFKRGRNAKANTMPKNASVYNYRMATGFEALIGFLYITGSYDRLNEILNIVINMYENK